MLKVVGPLGEKFKFFITLEFRLKKISITYTNFKWMTKFWHMIEKQQQFKKLLNMNYGIEPIGLSHLIS